ncbi:MAG TPA: hypothetical protein VJ949_14900 [Cryomorphaceae bacterium]|nr:hypothetical protein [Cryomorphaceae bacterium]
MCTVSYLPRPGGSIVTANRDESPLRNADGLSSYSNKNDQEFLIAKEPLYGGTNLAIGKEFTTVLLNGAFFPHESKLNYRKSRGLVVLDSLNLSSLNNFHKDALDGVEPFTLLRFGKVIEELRWDESVVHFRTYDSTKPLIVGSAKLYSREALEKRQVWFEDLLYPDAPGRREIWNFHVQGGDGDPENDMVMNRFNMVCTVSVSQVYSSQGKKKVRHLDLIRNQSEEIILEL